MLACNESTVLLLVHLDCRRRHHLQALHNLRGSARAGLSLPLLAPLHHLPKDLDAFRAELYKAEELRDHASSADRKERLVAADDADAAARARAGADAALRPLAELAQQLRNGSDSAPSIRRPASWP